MKWIRTGIVIIGFWHVSGVQAEEYVVGSALNHLIALQLESGNIPEEYLMSGLNAGWMYQRYETMMTESESSENTGDEESEETEGDEKSGSYAEED
jgi:hypothetical protein